MKNIPCTVGIITLNNEATLERTLKSLRNFEEIIICDGNSTDKTVEIAKKYGCKVIPQYKSKKKNIRIKDKSKVRNKTINAATNDWYFYIDSDDIASPQLVKSIHKVCLSKTPKHLIWLVNCKIKLDSKIVKHSASYPDKRVMLIHKSTKAQFYKSEHEVIRYNTKKYSKELLKGNMYLCWTKERAGKAYWHKAQSWLERDFQRIKDLSFKDYLRWGIWFNITSASMYFLKGLRNHIIYGSKYSMPLTVEFFRTLYHLKMIFKLTQYKLAKIWN